MDLLKLKVRKNKQLIFLGEKDGNNVYQVIKRGVIKKNFWKTSFIIEKGKKRKLVCSLKEKKVLTEFFTSTITLIALELVDNVDVVDYVGELNGFYLWEAWQEDSLDKLSSVYIFYNCSNYIVIQDKKTIDEIKASLLLQSSN